MASCSPVFAHHLAIMAMNTSTRLGSSRTGRGPSARVERLALETIFYTVTTVFSTRPCHDAIESARSWCVYTETNWSVVESALTRRLVVEMAHMLSLSVLFVTLWIIHSLIGSAIFHVCNVHADRPRWTPLGIARVIESCFADRQLRRSGSHDSLDGWAVFNNNTGGGRSILSVDD